MLLFKGCVSLTADEDRNFVWNRFGIMNDKLIIALNPYSFLFSSTTCRKVKEFPFLINKAKNPGKTKTSIQSVREIDYMYIFNCP